MDERVREDADGFDFFADALSADGQRAVPVHYRFISSRPAREMGLTRLAESLPYRSRGYLCWPFYKPISRCLDAEPES